MSYDVSLVFSVEGLEEGVFAYESNYTSNLGAVFHCALGRSFVELDGMRAVEVEPILARAVAILRLFPAQFTHLEPANGWGSVSGATSFLVLLRDRCREYPQAIVQVAS